MTEHTKTDGLPVAGSTLDADDRGPDAPRARDTDAATGRGASSDSPPRGPKRAGDKVECNACPVLCQISVGKTGACDRYANVAGALVRVDPVVLLRRTLDADDAAVVSFATHDGRPTAPASPFAPAPLFAPAPRDDVFVTGIGASTTYPDYKPAPFIVASRADGVDVVTVVTEGIFSYCSFKVKIDTDRYLGPEQANVRCDGEIVGHVTTAEYGSQMLSLGGVHHLTGGSRKEGRVTVETMEALGNKARRRRCRSTAARRSSCRPVARRSSTASRSGACASAAARRRSASSRGRWRSRPTRSSSSTTTSPAC